MKKKKAAIIIFIVVLVFPMVSWPFLYQVPDVEITEKRELAEFPDFDSKFFVNFDKFFTDHVPFRGAYITLYSNLKARINNLYMGIADNIEQKPNIPYIPLTPPYPQKDELEILYELLKQPRPERPMFIIENDVVWGKDGRDGWLFFYGQDSLEYFLGTNIPTEEEMRQMVIKAEKLNDYFEAQGKEFVIYVAPNKEQIYYEHMRGGDVFSQLPKRWDLIAAYFKKYSNVRVIYPKKEILAAKENMQIYLKYDTHWNCGGGYFGSRELLKALQIETAGAEFVQITNLDNDLRKMLPAEPAPDVDFKVSYRTDINLTISGDGNHYENFLCESDNPNGKTMFILGDSFRERMLPILGKEFSKIYGYHRTRFYKENNAKCYEKEIDQSDVVVFEAVERVGDDIFDVIDRYCLAYGIY